MHELVTEHFYNRTWTPRGDGSFNPELVLDNQNNPIKKEAFGVTFHVYKQSRNDRNILLQRKWTAEKYSTNTDDNNKDLLLMYLTYPQYTGVNVFKEPPNNMGPVYYISENHPNYKEYYRYFFA
jgi:hypothetical protein